MTHMSFHGALGNMAAADAALAEPLVRAVADFDPALIVSSSASRAIEDAAARCGLRVRDDLPGRPRLRRRRPAGAAQAAGLGDQGRGDAVLARVRQLLEDGTVITYSGKTLPMQRAFDPACTATRPARWRWRATIRGVVEAGRAGASCRSRGSSA